MERTISPIANSSGSMYACTCSPGGHTSSSRRGGHPTRVEFAAEALELMDAGSQAGGGLTGAPELLGDGGEAGPYLTRGRDEMGRDGTRLDERWGEMGTRWDEMGRDGTRSHLGVGLRRHLVGSRRHLVGSMRHMVGSITVCCKSDASTVSPHISPWPPSIFRYKGQAFHVSAAHRVE